MKLATADDLRALRDKYERMLALRRAHERARLEPGFVEPDPRAELARLAAAFPGALRELDRLPLDAIDRRIEALAAAERRGALEPWMSAQIAFHREARGALAAKRWLAGRRTVTPALRAAFLRSLADGSEARAFADALDAVASPPGGRLTGLVYERVARALGVTPREARALVRGPA